MISSQLAVLCSTRKWSVWCLIMIFKEIMQYKLQIQTVIFVPLYNIAIENFHAHLLYSTIVQYNISFKNTPPHPAYMSLFCTLTPPCLGVHCKIHLTYRQVANCLRNITETLHGQKNGQQFRSRQGP